jgi:cell division protein FtsN
MRDMERIKPKYNVTLDNKQIVMLIISSLVILVLVFIIGFVLGKNAGIRESQEASASSRGNMPQNAVVFTQQTMQSSGQPSAQPSGQGVTQSAEEGQQAPAVEQAPGGAATQTTAAVKHTELTFYKSLTQGGKQGKEEKKPAKKTEKKKIEKKKTAQVAKGKFSIQCGAFRERAQAERLTSELKKKYNLASWIEPITGKEEKLYRVKVGHFETREQAQNYQKHRLLPKGLRNCVITVDK